MWLTPRHNYDGLAWKDLPELPHGKAISTSARLMFTLRFPTPTTTYFDPHTY